MPIVAHTDLPSFASLSQEGLTILDPERARHQDIRELHIGLLNMMPDAALAATERQFFRLIGESNPIAQFYMHPFTLDALPRGPEARERIDRFYEPFAQIREEGLDALVISGANPVKSSLAEEDFWAPLIEVFEWASDNVTSTLCSCLATHAVMEFHYNQRRLRQKDKVWGVFEHRVTDKSHPLVNDVNTRFDVPHSRWNAISREQFEAAGLRVLVASEQTGVHLATSADGLRTVMFQGHPEYDTNSLLKEFKREALRYIAGDHEEFPPFPANYLQQKAKAVFSEYRLRVQQAMDRGREPPAFPESLVQDDLDNTWHDTAEAVVGNWVGLVYQVTHRDRRIPFMEGVDPRNPLQLASA